MSGEQVWRFGCSKLQPLPGVVHCSANGSTGKLSSIVYKGSAVLVLKLSNI